MKTRRQVQNRYIRKIAKVASGTSYSVTIPIDMMRKLKWKERQKVVFKLSGKNIIISDWKK